MSLFAYILIVLAIGAAVLAEVLVAYQKYQLKKEFSEELESLDEEQTNYKPKDSK